ncbi:DUF3786 domain-containing protein [Thermodesulfobacteriota bacterium]
MTEQKKNTFEVAYEEAFTLGCEQLQQKDLAAWCTRAGARVRELGDARTEILISFLHKPVRVCVPDFTFTAEDGTEIGVWEKILILHYLNQCEGTPLSNDLINYRQVKDGATYYPTFEKRSIKPLLKFFGSSPEKLGAAAAQLGAERAEHGDYGVRIMAFPLVPLYYVVWKGDDEFPPEANILFDATIEQNLSAEDIAVLCQQVVFQMVKNL